MIEAFNIVVCIKQVPETTEIEFDEETGRLKREGVDSINNPFDEYAIEEALRLKEKYGGRTHVLTMGPPWAKDALRDAIAMGIDILTGDRLGVVRDGVLTAVQLANAEGRQRQKVAHLQRQLESDAFDLRAARDEPNNIELDIQRTINFLQSNDC